MADDGSAESEGGGAVAAADVEFVADVRETVRVLRHRGQISIAALAHLLVRLRFDAALLLVDADVRLEEVVGDPALFDTFRRHVVTIRSHYVPILQRVRRGDEGAVSRDFRRMVLRAAQRAAGLIPAAPVVAAEPYGNGGFGAVPATAAAVRSLEKQTFRASAAGDDAITDCGICFEEFVDGAQVSVMPCPCRGHRFHPECIAKWLGISNMCPLCRHKLPSETEASLCIQR